MATPQKFGKPKKVSRGMRKIFAARISMVNQFFFTTLSLARVAMPASIVSLPRLIGLFGLQLFSIVSISAKRGRMSRVLLLLLIQRRRALAMACCLRSRSFSRRCLSRSYA
jgi:hypothetical protein